MNAVTVRTCFVPTPAGLLHLGNARTALFNALYAHRHRGVCLLRVENTDLQRSRSEYAAALTGDARSPEVDKISCHLGEGRVRRRFTASAARRKS